MWPEASQGSPKMSTPASAAAFLATLEAAIQSANTVKYCCVAGIAWMVYDIIINLDREIKHFWSGKWSLPRVLYFLNRYFSLARVTFFVYGLFHPLSNTLGQSGTVSIYMQTWTGAFEIWFLQIILIYRDLPPQMLMVILSLDISSLLIWQSPHVPAGTEWTTGFTAPVFSITGTRLLLNLREYGGITEYINTGGTRASEWRDTEPHSAIEFAERRAPAANSTFDDSSTAIRATILHHNMHPDYIPC
ncbi:hypothetical protein B0H15DRAFT_988954 [Mycena belliarum]|uniref:DUF6533 domain-containing protein n=1 Tax=Mycena belliarum TaxID=1033014 RepID=A0AAD6U3W1_9AGAR|nr:hypothetical protein B0H15DRAFT_988954 [Mycena belliae]